MGKMQRTKGAVGERELARLLRERLGLATERNLEQARSGGADLLGVGPFALEVKRREVLCITTWWSQAIRQAPEGMKPALAYRQNRHPWKFIVRLQDIGEDLPGDLRAELCIDGFCSLVRRQAEGKGHEARVALPEPSTSYKANLGVSDTKTANGQLDLTLS